MIYSNRVYLVQMKGSLMPIAELYGPEDFGSASHQDAPGSVSSGAKQSLKVKYSDA